MDKAITVGDILVVGGIGLVVVVVLVVLFKILAAIGQGFSR